MFDSNNSLVTISFLKQTCSGSKHSEDIVSFLNNNVCGENNYIGHSLVKSKDMEGGGKGKGRGGGIERDNLILAIHAGNNRGPLRRIALFINYCIYFQNLCTACTLQLHCWCKCLW